MAEARGAPRRRRQRRKGLVFKPLAYLVLIIAMMLGISVFFKITNIEVEGNLSYSNERIVETSGMNTGENLFFINKNDIEKKIAKQLPYIDEISITQKLPGTILIDVSESFPIANILYEGHYLIIDKKGKVLSADSSPAGTIRVIGFTPEPPESGEYLQSSDTEMPKLEYLRNLLELLLEKDMYSNVSEINLNNISNVSFEYEGRFTVELGKYERLEVLDKKLSLLDTLVRQELDENDYGIIDISSDGTEAHIYQR